MSRRKTFTRKDEKAIGGLVVWLLKAAFFVFFFPITLPVWIYLTFFRKKPACDVCSSVFGKADTHYDWNMADGSKQRVCSHCNALMRKKSSAAAVRARV